MRNYFWFDSLIVTNLFQNSVRNDAFQKCFNSNLSVDCFNDYIDNIFKCFWISNGIWSTAKWMSNKGSVVICANHSRKEKVSALLSMINFMNLIYFAIIYRSDCAANGCTKHIPIKPTRYKTFIFAHRTHSTECMQIREKILHFILSSSIVINEKHL